MFKKIVLSLFIFLLFIANTTSTIFAEDVERIFAKPGDEIYLTGSGTLDISSSEYNANVAKAETIETTGGDQIIHLGNNKEFNDGIDKLSSCLYKFEKVTDGRYKISSVSQPQYYLRTAESNISIFHSENENIMMVDSVDFGENGNVDMYFGFTQDSTTRRLFFEYEYNKTPFTFNKCYYGQANKQSVSILFRIYKQHITDDGITYDRVNSFDEIVADGKYIIAARTSNTTTDNTLYVLRPKIEYSSFAQTAKWVIGEKEGTTTKVKVEVTSANDGGYSCFKIGDKSYRISKAIIPSSDIITSDIRIDNGGAHNGEVISKLTISKGDSYKVTTKQGDIAQYWMSKDDGIASVDQDGTIAANNIDINQGYGKTYIGYMDSNNNMHCIEVVVIDTATTADTTHTDLYMEIKDSDVTVNYSFILDNMKIGHDSYDGVVWDDHALKDAYDKEVFYIDTENNEEYAILFFAKTSSDKEFVTNDILNMNHSTGVEDKKFLEVDAESIDSYTMLTNIFKEEYVTSLLDIAKNKGYSASVVLNKPTAGILSNHLKIDSSYIIDLVKPYPTIDGKTYALNVEAVTGDTSSYQETFNLSTKQYENSKFFDIYISEDGSKIEDVELSKKLKFKLDVSDLQNYDHTKIENRTFVVYSIHDGQIINWGEYSTDANNEITLKADKYSIFAVVSKDQYKNQPGYIPPKTGIE